MLLESDSPKDEAKPFRMARDVYKSCMDKEAIEALGIQPIKDILKQFGGWPGVNLTYILRSNFTPIFWSQKYKS
jgi:hypothetical protein